MGLAKKGTRLITIDDVEYRWVVQPDDEPGLGIVVELAENPGQRMMTWVEYGNVISPWLVRKAILYALEQGWHPAEKGTVIVFRFEGILQKEDEWGSVPKAYWAKWTEIYQQSQE